MAEIDNTIDDPRQREPLVLGGKDFTAVTDTHEDAARVTALLKLIEPGANDFLAHLGDAFHGLADRHALADGPGIGEPLQHGDEADERPHEAEHRRVGAHEPEHALGGGAHAIHRGRSALLVVAAVLVTFPLFFAAFLALPVLIGGVTFDQFWRTVLALVSGLFYAMAAGFAASSVCVRQFPAIALGTGGGGAGADNPLVFAVQALVTSTLICLLIYGLYRSSSRISRAIGPTGTNIYWISIAAGFTNVVPFDFWGWKTRPRDAASLAPDDAVEIYDPLDPSVQIRWWTTQPAAAHLARVAPHWNSTSSGWAPRQRMVSALSGRFRPSIGP